MNDGRRAGKYHVLAPLGQGGMGLISLGLAVGPDDFWQCAVLKSLRPEHASDEEYVAMFADEARLAARLQHPNVVRALGVEGGPGGRVLALEFLEGQTLGSVCERVGHAALPLGLHLFALAEVLAGLHYAHELTDLDGAPLDVVHRDISPHNVFVTYDGHVKLLDFGIAKAAKNRARTKIGTLKGKLSYMAPEQAAAAFDGGQLVDRRADVYAVGVMLWEALAGRWRARDGAVEEELLAGLLMGEVPDLRAANPGVDPALAAVCERATAYDPARRFPTAQAFRQALLEAAGGRVGRGDAEALGAVVARAFDGERRALRDLVRREVERLVAAGAVPASVRPAAPSLSALDAASAETLPGAAPPPAGPRGELTSSLAPTREPPSFVPVSRPSIKPPPPPSGDLAPPLEAPRRRRPVPGVLAGALSVALGAAGAVLLGLALRGRGPAAASAPPGASAPGRAAQVRLSVAAMPAGATLFLDGRPLDGNPFVGAVERDGRPHRVRAELPGGLALERDVAFDHDVALELSLEPAPKAADELGLDPAPKAADAAARPASPASPPPARSAPARPARPRDRARPAPLSIDETVPF
ncbi:MAG TPA: protein kinase [Polyangiaceae bacterium]|nr:protein kinase [Polyangiaceae bacterium]